MRGTIAKRLRRQAKSETKGKEDPKYYFTSKGEKFLTIDCERGRYRALKQMHRYARRIYKVMPELRIVSKAEGTGKHPRTVMPKMRELLDFSQGL